ncbi:DUF72 domain-containing protein [Haloechinothrix sp. LS1_15]|uniref:DUF72 domain-containing protein n=1 Tax=Haloechinothrix sp. LS1_15 TaxID=2652248 RepID=UPI0029472F5C|nr:DUF72 domain-containing protein [Haloechinothrix sp. LS1_15]MDV6014407.1 DUF72 domain-containing protein [Haloechinothrix sp. LS1_15]
MAVSEIRIGTSGWQYAEWRGSFYPKGLVQRRELAYLSGQLGTVEINGTFYSLQRPESFRAWYEQTPEDFVFALKGGRFITHMKQLRNVAGALANYFASGPLALGGKLGPIVWQLPPRMRFDAERLAGFFAQLPRTTTEAAEVATGHDDKIKGDPHTEVEGDRPLRHALEVRHPSFATAECVELLREHDIGLVVADSAGQFPRLDDVTSDFVYIRLHGERELYAGGYTDEALREWARLIETWATGDSPRTEHTVAGEAPKRPRDVYLYFDNDEAGHAPHDATRLAAIVGATAGTG